jgi:N-acetyl-alpha-D-muramate 1-phosphate uridylyltransferase
MYPVVILAGGKATRIREITKDIPKSLIKINNRPFIDYQLEYLKKHRIKKVIFCLGHKGDLIKNYLEEKHNNDFEFIYTFDGSTPLGTGGAVKKAMITKHKFYFIIYGDSYLRLDLKNIKKKFEKSKKPGLMTVIKNENKWDKSNVELKNRDILNYNKFKNNANMNYIDYGLSIISKKSIVAYEKKIFDLAEFFSFMIKQRKMTPYIAKKRFFEIGSFRGIKDLKKHISV